MKFQFCKFCLSQQNGHLPNGNPTVERPGLWPGLSGAAVPSSGGTESCTLRKPKTLFSSSLSSASIGFTHPRGSQLSQFWKNPGVDLGDRDRCPGSPTGCVSEITMRIRDEREMVPDISELTPGGRLEPRQRCLRVELPGRGRGRGLVLALPLPAMGPGAGGLGSLRLSCFVLNRKTRLIISPWCGCLK